MKDPNRPSVRTLTCSSVGWSVDETKVFFNEADLIQFDKYTHNLQRKIIPIDSSNEMFVFTNFWLKKEKKKTE